MSSTSSGYTRITRDHAAAIGYVVTNWGLVEARLAQTIGILLGTNSMPTYAITAETTSEARMQVITTLVNLAGRPLWKATWKGLASDLRALRTMRNDLVHAEWRGTQNALMPNTATRVKARGGRVEIRLHFPSTRTLREMAESIAGLEDRLAVFQGALFLGDAASLIANPDRASAPDPQGRAATPSRPERIPKRELKRLRKEKVAALKKRKPAS